MAVFPGTLGRPLALAEPHFPIKWDVPGGGFFDCGFLPGRAHPRLWWVPPPHSLVSLVPTLPEHKPGALWLPPQPELGAGSEVLGRPGLGAELAGCWWWPGCCPRASVSSQPAGFLISISVSFAFWPFGVTGQGSFLWCRVGPGLCRTSGWREGRSQPGARGSPGLQCNSFLAAGPQASPFISLSLHFLVGKMCAPGLHPTAARTRWGFLSTILFNRHSSQ